MGFWPWKAQERSTAHSFLSTRSRPSSHARLPSHSYSHSHCELLDMDVDVKHYENGDLEVSYWPSGRNNGPPSTSIPQHILDGVFSTGAEGEKAEDYSWSGCYGTFLGGRSGGHRPRHPSGLRSVHPQSQVGSHHGSHHGSQHGSRQGSLQGSHYGSLHGSAHGSAHGSHHGSRDGSQHGGHDGSHHGSRASSHARSVVSDPGLSGMHQKHGVTQGHHRPGRTTSQAGSERSLALSGAHGKSRTKSTGGLNTIPEGGGEIGPHSSGQQDLGPVAFSSRGDKAPIHSKRSERSKW